MRHEDWLVLCGLLGLAVAAAVLDAWAQRREARRWRIRAEESDAWADEYQREAAALAAELDGLRKRNATLTALYGEAVRRLLAVNYVVIYRNLEWKRQRGEK